MRSTLLPLILIAGLGCTPEGWTPDKLGVGHTDRAREKLERGREVYAGYCAGCHGENGDGNGPAAEFLNPKPRNFKVGRIKFGWVESGQSASDDDYFRVITRGLKGTAMPAFHLLTEDERWAVVEYIRTFYADRAEDPPGAEISVGADPWTDDVAGGIEAGRAAYHGIASCWSCHPAYESKEKITEILAEAELPPPNFPDDLYEAKWKDSQWGSKIRAPDFLVTRIKNGTDLDVLVRTVAAGVGGTAMPTWAGSLEPEQLWGIAYYVRSIALARGTDAGRMLAEARSTAAAK